jgi:hypothetical protein
MPYWTRAISPRPVSRCGGTSRSAGSHGRRSAPGPARLTAGRPGPAAEVAVDGNGGVHLDVPVALGGVVEPAPGAHAARRGGRASAGPDAIQRQQRANPEPVVAGSHDRVPGFEHVLVDDPGAEQVRERAAGGLREPPCRGSVAGGGWGVGVVVAALAGVEDGGQCAECLVGDHGFQSQPGWCGRSAGCKMSILIRFHRWGTAGAPHLSIS